MIKIEMKKYNTKLTGKQQKYQHFRLVKLINMNFFQEKKYEILSSDQRRIIQQPKFTYSPLN